MPKHIGVHHNIQLPCRHAVGTLKEMPKHIRICYYIQVHCQKAVGTVISTSMGTASAYITFFSSPPWSFLCFCDTNNESVIFLVDLNYFEAPTKKKRVGEFEFK